MTTLVVGATGMTGRLLVKRLLDEHQEVRAIVRSPHKLPAAVLANPNMAALEVSILELTDEKMTEIVKGCDAVVSCLGHVLSFKRTIWKPEKAVHGRNAPFM